MNLSTVGDMKYLDADNLLDIHKPIKLLSL